MKRMLKALLAFGLLWGNTGDSLFGSPENSTLSHDGFRGVTAVVNTGVWPKNSPSYLQSGRRVPPATLDRAIREADRIFQAAGVEMEWIKCGVDNQNAAKAQECEEPAGPLALNLRIALRHDQGSSRVEDTFFGVAQPYQDGGVHATLFYQHIDSFATAGSASRSLVLAHTMAHETGHLLLWSNSHSPTGIMQASWRRADLKAIEQGQLAFSPSEAESMRANLLARQKQFQLLIASDASSVTKVADPKRSRRDSVGE